MTLVVVLLALVSTLSALKLETQQEESFFDAVNDIFTFTEDNYAVDDNNDKTVNDGDPFGMGGFFTALFLIPFALVLLWKNEKKLVTYQRCMARAAKECLTINPKELNEIYNNKLVHVTGKTENKAAIVDQDFGVSVDQSYRLRRRVEMYQW